MSLQTVRGLAAVALLLAGGTGCSALSGRDNSDKSYSAPAPRPSTSVAKSGAAAYSHPTTATKILADLRRDLVAVYTIDYHHLSRNRTAALAAVTGNFSDSIDGQFSDASRAVLREAEQTQEPQVDVVGLAGLADEDRRAYAYGSVAINAKTKDSGAITRYVRAAVTLKLDDGRWKISKVALNGFPKGTLPANKELATAAKAAKLAVSRLYAFTRSDSGFDKTYNAALTLQTAEFQAQSQRQRSSVEASVKKKTYDQTASVSSLAVKSIDSDGSAVQLIVRVSQYHLLTQGKRFGPYPTTTVVEMKHVDDRWLLDSANPVQ